MLIVPLFVSLLQISISLLYLLIYVGGVSSGIQSTLDSPASWPASGYRGIKFQLW